MASDSRLKALIIDNSPEAAAHTRDILSAVKIDVLEWIRNGTAWVEAFKKTRFDLVVVDYVLPKRDGLFVTEKIIEMDPPCAVIFTHSFEGWPANIIELKAYGAGAGACFQRPVSDIVTVCAPR
mgnify:CR=1 FL=1